MALPGPGKAGSRARGERKRITGRSGVSRRGKGKGGSRLAGRGRSGGRRPSHPARPAEAHERRGRGLRQAGSDRAPLRPPREWRTPLRGQGGRAPSRAAGGDQRPAGAPRPRRKARGPAEGRRPVRVRAGRRGGGGARRCGGPGRGGARRDLGGCGPRVRRGTAGPLADLPPAVERARIEPPALFIIGTVVRHADTLDWFGKRPLSGERLVIASPGGDLGTELDRCGAEVVEVPLPVTPAARVVRGALPPTR